MSNEADFYINKGDTSDPLEVTLRDDQNNTVDLSNASVKFQMAQVGASSLKVDSNEAADGLSSATDGDGVDIDDATNGDVTYHWDASDTDTAGYFNAYFLVDYSGGTGNGFNADQTFPNENYLVIKVDDDLP